MTQSLISDTLRDAILEQVGQEKQNANIYLYICGFLRNHGTSNLAEHFMEQHNEETEHAKMFFDLLTDMNADITRIPEIDEVNTPLANVLDIAKLYLEREIGTTNSINDLIDLALEERNPVCEQAFRIMVSKQQHEYSEATDWSDKAEITGGDWKFVLLWDLGLK